MVTGSLLENRAGVAGDRRKVAPSPSSLFDYASALGPSDQRFAVESLEASPSRPPEEPESPGHLRERAAGIRWALGFVKDDWRIRALAQLADQLDEAAKLLERKGSQRNTKAS